MGVRWSCIPRRISRAWLEMKQAFSISLAVAVAAALGVSVAQNPADQAAPPAAKAKGTFAKGKGKRNPAQSPASQPGPQTVTPQTYPPDKFVLASSPSPRSAASATAGRRPAGKAAPIDALRASRAGSAGRQDRSAGAQRPRQHVALFRPEPDRCGRDRRLRSRSKDEVRNAYRRAADGGPGATRHRQCRRRPGLLQWSGRLLRLSLGHARLAVHSDASTRGWRSFKGCSTPPPEGPRRRGRK